MWIVSGSDELSKQGAEAAKQGQATGPDQAGQAEERAEFRGINGIMAQQVFGQDLKQQQIHLQHTANLFYERCQLHKQHIQDIDDRHLKVQERLFGVEINNFPDRNKQLRTLEGQLMQLEQQRREEELAFWKDTVELRKELFESATDYRDTSQRHAIFSRVEGSYDRE